MNSDQNDKKDTYRQKVYETVPFGIALAAVGGFLDAYTYIGRHHVFANAQTGNLVLLGIYASSGEWKQALVYFPPILAFILGVLAVEMAKRPSGPNANSDWVRAALILEFAVLMLIGLIPPEFPDLLVTAGISFAASVQVSAFSKLVDSPYATTMMTGNLRSFTQAAYKALRYKDRDASVKAFRYLVVILTFIIGSVLGGVLTVIIGAKAIWIAAIILILTYCLFSRAKNRAGHAGS